MWAEETATDILLAEASPDVSYWKFTKMRESAVGADWLWWWIDSTNTCFGLLTQAKILKRKGSGWHIDFDYRPKEARLSQIDSLVVASRTFDVPAAHVLYCGNPAYRDGLDCGLIHLNKGNCRDRERAGVSVVPSIVPQYLKPRVGANLAAEVFHWSLPLEDIADPGRPQPPLRPLAEVHPDIAEFMRRPQVGARRVARTMLEAMHTIRSGQFSAAMSEAEPVREAVFSRLPVDRGHFSVPYLAHVLGGLRHRPPSYVTDLLGGRIPPHWVTGAVAGIVIIRDPEPPDRHLATLARQGHAGADRRLALVLSNGEEFPAAVTPVERAMMRP